IEPNPFDEPKLVRRGLLFMAAFFVLLMCSGFLSVIIPANETMAKQTFISKDSAQDTEVFISDPFVMPKSRNSVSVKVSSQVTKGAGKLVTVHTALLNKDKGNVYIIDVGKHGVSNIPSVEPGSYVIRMEHAKKPKRPDAVKDVETTTVVTVVRDEVRFSSLLCIAFVGLFFVPILWIMRKISVETKRWSESNVYHGGE
ncbi:MAG: hypothetical protein VX278_02690, partial [Myxococcota bacterium]|nr:hypothetical protein [Myxococcota bacterium]